MDARARHRVMVIEGIERTMRWRRMKRRGQEEAEVG